MQKVGLILEGGGMRGVFTSGILDFFLENCLYFENIYAVSAGACNAVSYVARQIGRNKTINIEYCQDKRYMSVRNFLKYKSMFGTKFIFEDLPYGEVPFDYETYYASNAHVLIGATNLKSGKIDYFEKDEAVKNVEVLKASCALPVVSAIVSIDGKAYLDGGITASIPIEKSIEEGNQKHIVVLTQDKDYVKQPSSLMPIVRRMYRKYPKFVEAFCGRHEMYNRERELVKTLEQEGKAFVYCPTYPVLLKRFEKNQEKLEALYQDGYSLVQKKFEDFKKFLER